MTTMNEQERRISDELDRRLSEIDGPLGVRDDEGGISFGPLWVADDDPRVFTEDAEFTVAQARLQALRWWAAAAAAERNRTQQKTNDAKRGGSRPAHGTLDGPPTPACVPAVERTGPAIRAALREAAPDELPDFEAEFHIALAEADNDFDVSRIDHVITHWWGIANVRLDPISEDARAVADALAERPTEPDRER